MPSGYNVKAVPGKRAEEFIARITQHIPEKGF